MIEFPATDLALEDPNGLLAVGGDLEPETLVSAYRRGIFPWFDDSQPILWWTPSPRAVLFPEHIHLSKSLRKTLRRSAWRVACDQAFPSVIAACTAPRPRQQGTWITEDMQAAYTRLHELGVAHSIEVYAGDDLIGGLYGLRLGRIFFGESMFSRRSDASKVALVALCWLGGGGRLDMIDCQMETGHLLSMGACSLPRPDFEKRLGDAINDIDVDLALLSRLPRSLDRQLDRVLPEDVGDLL